MPAELKRSDRLQVEIARFLRDLASLAVADDAAIDLRHGGDTAQRAGHERLVGLDPEGPDPYGRRGRGLGGRRGCRWRAVSRAHGRDSQQHPLGQQHTLGPRPGTRGSPEAGDQIEGEASAQADSPVVQPDPPAATRYSRTVPGTQGVDRHPGSPCMPGNG